MTITLPLQPREEARLIAAAQAKGLSAEALVREAVDKILAEAPDSPVQPKKSAFGLLAKYSPGPTEKEIEENRREILRGFGEDLPCVGGVADTHAALWYLHENLRLSVTARIFIGYAGLHSLVRITASNAFQVNG